MEKASERTERPRALVADDDPAMVELIHEVLKIGGWDVLVVGSGQAALDTLRREHTEGRPVDVLLLDIMMPDVNGYQVMAEVKNDPLLADTSILLTTALTSISNKTLGLGMGADDYLTKPFDPRELLARVEAIMRIRRTEKALRQRNRELATLNKIGRAVTSSLDLDEVLVATMQGIREILHVEAGSLVLVDEETDELVFYKTLSPEQGWITGRTFRQGEGIVGYVIATGQPYLVNDVANDPHFFPRVDGGADFTVRAVLCVPLIVLNK